MERKLAGRPLGDVAPNASAEIYLNGERLADTWPLPMDRLVLPDAQCLRPLEATAAWLAMRRARDQGGPWR